jgi:flagellar biosynthesis protein FliR
MAPDLIRSLLNQFQGYLLILMRVGPILFLMPVFSSKSVPALPKVGLTLVLALVLLPAARIGSRPPLSEPLEFGFFLVSELMVGFILGLSVKLIFTGIQMAGELAGFQMGLAMASVIDPQSGADTPVLSQFYYLAALILFLSIDGHHWFFRAMVESFRVLPSGEYPLTAGVYSHLMNLSGRLLQISFQIAAPVMAILIFTQVALGLIARTVPQVNILMVSFPLTIGLGLIFIELSMELLVPYLKTLLQDSGEGLTGALLPLMRR